MKKYKRIVDNKMRGAYGDIDDKKKIIRVNKKIHKGDPKWSITKKENTIINTIMHEEMHAKHPKLNEKGIRNKTNNWLAQATEAMKKKHYSLYNNK